MSESSIIQKTIEYIEMNLQEDLSLDRVAQFAGFSKFHYHRMFQKEVGVTVVEYIRYRRVANAATMLLYSDERILDIAFQFHFETQESFTRSFKQFYKLPPGQYRKLMGKLTMQKEEIMLKNEQLLKGWNLSGSHPHYYEIGIDRENIHKGKASGYIKSTATEQDGFGTMMQEFKADKYLGKRIKLSGFLKSKNVTGYCGFWMRVDDALEDVLQFDNMGNRPIVGDTEWNHYQIVLDVPKNSAVIAFGVLLTGLGHVWIDELKFEEVDLNTPTTHIEFKSELLDEPMNLSFEE